MLPLVKVKIRRAISLVELIVVLAILAAMLGLLLPAVQAAREKSREAICKNNLRQLNLAVAHFAKSYNRLPAQNPADEVGGWTIEILPFLEQANLEQHVSPGIAITNAPEILFRPPSIFRCPVRESLVDDQDSKMNMGHYVLVASDRRGSYSLYDAPLDLSIPWAAGPEMPRRTVTLRIGPHHDGYFVASGLQRRIKYVSSAASE